MAKSEDWSKRKAGDEKGKKMMRFGFAAALVCWGGAATAMQTVGLKTYVLGSSIAELRSQTLSTGKYGPRRVRCSDDEGAPAWIVAALPSMVACSFEEQIGSSWVRSDLLLDADRQATVMFHYADGKLALIEAYMDQTGASVVEESLMTRFGKPSSRATRAFQVQSGATFPQQEVEWAIGNQTVTLLSPDLTIRRMSVIYRDESALARAKAQTKPADIM
jgi:hypothetical protein